MSKTILRGNDLPNFLEEDEIFIRETDLWVYEGPVGGGTPVRKTGEFFNDYRLIREVGDFPAPTGNEIVLASNTLYEVTGNINIGNNTIRMNENTVLMGKAKANDGITTSASTLVTGDDSSVYLTNLTLSCPNGNALDFNSSSSTQHNFYSSNCIVKDSSSIGSIQNYRLVTFIETDFLNNDDGIEFNGTLERVGFVNGVFEGNLSSSSNSFILFGSQIDLYSIDIRGNTFFSDVGNAIRLVNGINITSKLSISSNIFKGDFEVNVGFQASSRFVTSQGNIGFANSTDIPTLVRVRSLLDLPIPNEQGEIILEPNTKYQIVDEIMLGTNRIITNSGNSIFGNHKTRDGFIYTGTDFAITSTDNSLTVRNLFITAPAGGNGISWTSSDNIENCQFNDLVFVNVNECISIDGGNIVVILENLYVESINTAISLNGSIDNIYILTNVFKGDQPNGGSTILGNGSLQINNILEIRGNYFNVEDTNIGVNLSSLADYQLGTLTNNNFQGEGVYIGGSDPIEKGDIRWIFSGNFGIENSIITGFLSFVNNLTSTIIPTTTTYYKAAGVNASQLGERFTITNNRITLNDVTSRLVSFTCTGAFTCTSGNNRNALFAIFKNQNGVATTSVANRVVETEYLLANNNQPYAFSVSGVVEMEPGDHLEVFVRNLTAAANIRVIDLQFSANGQF